MRIGIIILFFIGFSCKEEPNRIVSFQSPFYKEIIGTYNFIFWEDKAPLTIHFNADSTFKIDAFSTAREYYNGKWYLSDSILLIDFCNWGWRGCLTFENVHEIDTTGKIELYLKFKTFDSTGFSAVQMKNNKFSKKTFVQAKKVTLKLP